MNNFLAIIPARYASTRFPGKPLADIKGKPMIQRVYDRVSKAVEHIVVATDDERIYDCIIDIGGNVVMTSESHQSGTDRCWEALQKYQQLSGKDYEVVINVQGDEPFIVPEQINILMQCFNEPAVQIATLIKEVENKEYIFDTNKPKVVFNKNNEAILFSRSPIPNLRNFTTDKWHLNHTYFHHIGMYAYRSEILQEITRLEPSLLEKAESLEQLRWLENGYKIKTAVTKYETFGIDTPEDLNTALKMNLL